MAASFTATPEGVVWLTDAGLIPLTDAQCEALMDLLEPQTGYAAVIAFHDLLDAHHEAGGIVRPTFSAKPLATLSTHKQER